MALNNTPILVPMGNVSHQPPLFHAYSSPALHNQPYFLSNHPHHQFGYYPFYPPHYSPYAASWATAAFPYLPHSQIAPTQQQNPSQLLSTANLNDPIRLPDTSIYYFILDKTFSSIFF